MYQLKQPDIDLTRHVATKAGVRRYHLAIGSPLGRGGSPVGKHLTASSSVEAMSMDASGVTFEQHVRRLDVLMQKVQNNEDSETVDENAWAEVATRLDAMNKIARAKENEMKTERRRAAKIAEGAAAVGATTGVALLLKSHAPARAIAFTKEWANESVAHSLAVSLTSFATSAASLIGAQESTHFVEAFQKIVENPAVDIGVTSAMALIISAFITRIRKALKERKDKKIARARGEKLPGSGETP